MEPGVWLLWATLAASLVYYLSNSRRRRSNSGSTRLPPGPRPFPFIGNALDLRGGHLHHELARLARAYGPVMHLTMGPGNTAVVVSSTDAAKEAFTRHDRRHAARKVTDAVRALEWADRSLLWLPSSDPRWKAQRGLVATHIVSPRSLTALRGVREHKVQDLVRYFRRRAGQEVQVGKALYAAMLNLISSCFFSAGDVVELDDAFKSSQGIRQHMEEIDHLMVKPNISDLFRFLRPLDLQGLRRKAAGHLAQVFSIMDGIIDRRLADASYSTHKQNDFLDAVMDLMPGGSFSRQDVTTLAFDIFVAGSDNVATAVERALAELLRHPSIMAKVRAEIHGALAGNKQEGVTETVAASLPYLQAVVKETMRLHPMLPLLVPHQATEDGMEISGYTVPKGSAVIFNAWAIMRDPAVWDRPDEFIPERFLDGATGVDDAMGKEKDYTFIPFGSGRRQCPGQNLAECVVPHILAELVHAFEWRLPESLSTEKLDIDAPLKAVPTLNVKG